MTPPLFFFSLQGYEAVEFVSQEEEEEAAKALARRRSSIKIGGGIQMALLNAGKLKVDNATSGIAGAFRKIRYYLQIIDQCAFLEKYI